MLQIGWIGMGTQILSPNLFEQGLTLEQAGKCISDTLIHISYLNNLNSIFLQDPQPWWGSFSFTQVHRRYMYDYAPKKLWYNTVSWN